MKASLASHLENYLKNGGHKIDEWYASLNVATASFDDLHAFENVNTPDELKRLQDLPDNDTGR